MNTHNEISKVAFLRGKRVVLRPLTKEDVPQMYVWVNDPELLQYLGMYLPTSLSKEEKWLEGLDSRNGDITFGIEVAGKLIGTMGIHRIDWKNRTATTGAMIGEKSYQGKGYGTEAKMLLLNYAFNTLNLRKIYSEVIAYNARSLAYSLHCGYKVEGRKIKDHFKNGKYHDLIVLGLFKKDWLPHWKKHLAKN